MSFFIELKGTVIQIEKVFINDCLRVSKVSWKFHISTIFNFAVIVENELNKLKTFDWSYFIGKSRLEEDGTQNYLVFQPINKYFKVIANTDYVSSWKSKGLSAESIKPPTTSDNSLTLSLSYYGAKTRVKFVGSCLKQPKISYTHGKVVNCLWIWCI